MLLKTNVLLDGVTDKMLKAAYVVDLMTRQIVGREAIVTSAKDGVHGDNSLHYSGNAMDFRTKDMAPMLQGFYKEQVARALGNDFDVVLEKDHLHVEYDPD